MNIVTPEVELISITPDPAQHLENCGRTCYRSEDKCDNTRECADRFIKRLMARKHYSVLEHATATISFSTNRGVTHEMVRHRIAAYSQESTRYCDYGDCGVKVQEPTFKNPASYAVWVQAMCDTERAYDQLRVLGEPPQLARSVLPICLGTKIVMTCNFREWLHVFDLRRAAAAHPDIRHVMDLAFGLLNGACPEVFNADCE